MDEAREEADLELLFQLAAHAQGKRGDDFDGPEGRFDPDQAMRTIRFRDNRKRGRHSPRGGPPPSIEAVTERVVRLARAVKRQRSKTREKRGDGHQ
jgi:hypothetical protein